MRNNRCFVLRKIYDQFLLFPVCANEVGNELISINEVGADIWLLAGENRSESEIVDQIEKIYNLEKGSVEEQAIFSFLSLLCEQKLLFRDEEDQ